MPEVSRGQYAAPASPELREVRVQVAEVRRDLGADRGDRGDRARRDDPDEQAVLNQVLTFFVPNELAHERLHLCVSFKHGG